MVHCWSPLPTIPRSLFTDDRAYSELLVGRSVYIRWHGDAKYRIVRIAGEVKKQMVHFVCEQVSPGATKGDMWIVPALHLSTKPISKKTGDQNTPAG